MKRQRRRDGLMAYGLGLAALMPGCAGVKAVDTTRAFEAATAGESKVTYTLIPGDVLADEPELADKIVALPTVPGKDVRFRAYYPDGAVRWELDTQRSAVLDMLFAAAAGVDAEKFAEDARVRQWLDLQRDFYAAQLQPFLDLGLQRLSAAPPPSEPDMVERLANALEPAIQAAVERVLEGVAPPEETAP